LIAGLVDDLIIIDYAFGSVCRLGKITGDDVDD
jgi:hypothetical protein